MATYSRQPHNCKRFQGKIAIITASSEGIGLAIAQRLAEEGAKIVISSRKLENIKKANEYLQKKGISSKNILALKCHVSNKDDRQKLFEETEKHFGGIDILVSNAAVNPSVGQVLDCSEDVWDKIFDVNVKASFLLAKEALPYLLKRGSGNIVFISSIAGFRPTALLGAYSVSKTTLFGLTKAISQDLARHNIRVNCVAPGIVKTKFAGALVETETAKEAALETIPMARLGEPDDISGVVAFLVSDDASYITGETIVAAGGTPASRL